MGLIKDIRDIEYGQLNQFLSLSKKTNNDWTFNVDFKKIYDYCNSRKLSAMPYLECSKILYAIGAFNERESYVELDASAIKYMDLNGIEPAEEIIFYVFLTNKHGVQPYSCDIKSVKYESIIESDATKILYDVLCEIQAEGFDKVDSCKLLCCIHAHQVDKIFLNFNLK